MMRNQVLHKSLRLQSLLNLVTNKILKSQYAGDRDSSSTRVLQTIVETVAQVIKVDLAILLFCQQDELENPYFIYQNLPDRQLITTEIDLEILRWTVWEIKEAIAIDNIIFNEAQKFPDLLESQQRFLAYQKIDIRSSLLVPVIDRLQLVAVIALHRCQIPQAWRDDEIQLMIAISAQAALAISQVTAYEQLSAFAKRESTINSINQSIRSSFEPKEIFKTIAFELGQALSVDSCTLSLWTKEDRYVHCVGLYNPSESIATYTQEDLPQSLVPIAENPILQELLRTHKPVVIEDLEQCQNMAGYNLPLRQRAKALLLVPLIVDGEITGSITLSQQKCSRYWRKQDIELAEAVATGAAIALQQARLYEKTRKQAELLLQSEQQVKQLNAYLRESVLKRFLPETIANKIAAGELILDFNPEPHFVTILYSDLVDFTGLSERLGAYRTAKLLNEYLESMTQVVFDYGGTVDKFIGDGLMALFGAPKKLSPKEQVQRAIATARSMYYYLDKLNQDWQSRGILKLNDRSSVRFRCGIHQGDAIVGMFGGGQRSDYTAIGSAVNIAARLQEVAAPDRILVSSTVAVYLEQQEIEHCQSVHLKGVEKDFRTFYVTI